MSTQAPNSLFSVVVPTFNRALLLPEALESLENQTYRPLEVIIVNDGSTDSTAQLVQNWVENSADSAFTVRYVEQANQGAAAARNTGLKEVTGEYVQFLDSDDRLHLERLQLLEEVFRKEGADFVQTGFSGFDPDSGEELQRIHGRPGENQLELAVRGNFWANTLRAAMTTDLALAIGPWRTEMSCFEDREYMERAVTHAVKAVAIEEVLAYARRGGSNRISDILRSYEGRQWRIFCEQSLVEAVKDRSDVSHAAKSAFASRLYGLAVRSNAEGWTELGRQCVGLAGSLHPSLDAKGLVRKCVALGGPVAARIYGRLGRIKQSVLQHA